MRARTILIIAGILVFTLMCLPICHKSPKNKEVKKEVQVDDMYTHIYKLESEFVDLGLSSGTLWANKNEPGGIIIKDVNWTKWHGCEPPTKEQFEELQYQCKWNWRDSGYSITGPNGNSIFLPAEKYIETYFSGNSRVRQIRYKDEDLSSYFTSSYVEESSGEDYYYVFSFRRGRITGCWSLWVSADLCRDQKLLRVVRRK